MSKQRDHSQAMPAECSDWLDEHPDEDRAAIEEVWRLAGSADMPFEPDPDRIVRMRSTLLGMAEKSITSSGRVVPLRTSVRWLAAAAIVIAVVAAWLLTPIRRSAGPGETLTIRLPDESGVHLNSGSSISYGRLFGYPTRKVSLDGEAFFEVKKGTGSFVVETFNGQITVAGTRFNVRAWPHDLARYTEVVVEEGVVLVGSAVDPLKSARLEAGQRAVLRDGVLEISADHSAESSGMASWRSGGMVFPDAPLGDVLTEIERRFGTAVTVTPDSLRGVHVSLFVTEARDPGTVLDMISASHGLHIEETGEGFEIKQE